MAHGMLREHLPLHLPPRLPLRSSTARLRLEAPGPAAKKLGTVMESTPYSLTHGGGMCRGNELPNIMQQVVERGHGFIGMLCSAQGSLQRRACFSAPSSFMQPHLTPLYVIFF